MQVKCEYCGSMIEDTEEKCPNCGAANENLKRTASGTPKTIEELAKWYKDRNLPPYETTRFFIGLDYKQPKAFGIYQDGEEFVVYKNKADGSRAVRYRGRDEAYAVNELYLRLKEEILNQKQVNAAKKNGKKKRGPGLLRSVIAKWIACGAICLSVCGILGFFIHQQEIRQTQMWDYYVSDSGIYYYHGFSFTDQGTTYEWWKFDDSTQDWFLYAALDNSKDYPEGVRYKDDVGYLSALAEKLGLEYSDYEEFKNTTPYNIDNSHTYIDAHHSNPHENAYYRVDGVTYYYLNDSHGETYGSGDNSGWYRYDDDSGWEYFSDGDDRSSLGDALWYSFATYYAGETYSDYTSGSVYDFSDSEAAEWSTASEFEDTGWYDEYEDANEAYEEYVEEHPNNSSSDSSDSDSGYDWDSSDSWDSGSIDWGSDW